MSYSPKSSFAASRSKSNSPMKFLQYRSLKKYSTPILVAGLVFLAVSVMMSYYSRHVYSAQETMDMNDSMRKLVDFSKSANGKTFMFVLWLLTALMLGVSAWLYMKRQQ